MITILQTRALRGPNVWARVPVMHMSVSLDGCNQLTSELPRIVERVLHDIPALAEHGCTTGCPGGFLAVLRAGTSLAHVLEHIALAIQELAGVPVSRGLTRPAGEDGRYHVVFAYRQEDVGRAAGELAVRYLYSLLDDSINFDLTQELENLTGVGKLPWEWPRPIQAVDIGHKGVYAFTTGLVADTLADKARHPT